MANIIPRAGEFTDFDPALWEEFMGDFGPVGPEGPTRIWPKFKVGDVVWVWGPCDTKEPATVKKIRFETEVDLLTYTKKIRFIYHVHWPDQSNEVYAYAEKDLELVGNRKMTETKKIYVTEDIIKSVIESNSKDLDEFHRADGGEEKYETALTNLSKMIGEAALLISKYHMRYQKPNSYYRSYPKVQKTVDLTGLSWNKKKRLGKDQLDMWQIEKFTKKIPKTVAGNYKPYDKRIKSLVDYPVLAMFAEELDHETRLLKEAPKE